MGALFMIIALMVTNKC